MANSSVADFAPSSAAAAVRLASAGPDGHWSTARLKVAMLVDRPSASQEVHLFRALRRLRRAGECALCIWSEDYTAQRAAVEPRWICGEFDSLKPDVLILSRYAGQAVYVALAAARERGIPVVTHLDDYLLDVPVELGIGKTKQHMRPERISALRASLADADLLYISTQSLARKIRATGFQTPIVVSDLQSCADREEIRPPPYYDPDSTAPVRIGYQGTRNHVHDLQMIASQLIAVMDARPDVTLTLFGTVEAPPEFAPIAHRIERLAPAGDYTSFLNALHEQRWDIGLAPLRELEFNSFRTYTKWTEYSMAGVCVIATDCAVYQSVMSDGAGLLVRNDRWREGLLHLIDSPLVRRQMVDKAQEALHTRLTLHKQEVQVLAMLEHVLKKQSCSEERS